MALQDCSRQGSEQWPEFFMGMLPPMGPITRVKRSLGASALASPSKIVTRVSIVDNYRAIVMACTGPAAGPRFKEI